MGAHDTQTVQREKVQTPGRVEERRTDSLLQFRDKWVRNRAREIWQAGSISFNTCSMDTASIRAMNEFYGLRIFDRFMTEQCEKKEMEIAMIRGPRAVGSFTSDVTPAERLHICRSVRREKGPGVLRKTYRQRATGNADEHERCRQFRQAATNRRGA
jgi:hypothetical protein